MDGVTDPFEISIKIYVVLFVSAIFAGCVTYAIRHKKDIESHDTNPVDFAIELSSSLLVAYLSAWTAGYLGYPPIVMLIAGTLGSYLNRTTLIITEQIIRQVGKNIVKKIDKDK